MPNVTTNLGDIINPQVMGDMINAKVEALCKMTPYAKVDTSLVGVPGDTKTVPCWNYIGDAEDFDPENTEGKEIETTKLTAGSSEFTVKCAAKSVSILQTAINSGLGNPVGQAETQLSKSIAGKVDNDVVAAAYTSNNIYDSSSTSIGYKPIVGAVCQFEDEEEDIDKVMFIHPQQEATMLQDPDFLSADKFTSGVAVNGSIGKVAGCWVKKSKKVKRIKYSKNESGTITIVDDDTTETSTKLHLSSVQPYCESAVAVGDKVSAVTNNYFMNPILKLEPDSEETEYTEDEAPAITIFLKKDIEVASEHFPKKQRYDITASKYYGVALTNAAKVIIAKFKA